MTQKAAGKVIVITGAASGIGAEIARQFDALGAKVALTDVKAEALELIAAEFSPSATTWVLDVTDDRQVAEVAQNIAQHYGKIDIVFANAGMGAGGTLTQVATEDFNRIITINLLGSANTARQFSPYLKKSRGYYLQNASLAALLPSALMSAYSASKAGVEAFARVYAQEMAHFGVDVGVVYFPWIKTPLVGEIDKNERLATMREGLPWPLNQTYELNSVIPKVVKGILQRKKEIFPILWVRGFSLIRGGISGIVLANAKKRGNYEFEE